MKAHEEILEAITRFILVSMFVLLSLLVFIAIVFFVIKILSFGY